jgi:hypothetical protein
MMGFTALVLAAGLAPSAKAKTSYFISPEVDARSRQICERIVRVGPGEAAFSQCVDSLVGSFRTAGQAIAVQPIRVAGSEEDDGMPYYANSPGMQFYRDQQACTQLGLTARAETNCVMNLSAALEDTAIQ